jgi:hypothetical protein
MIDGWEFALAQDVPEEEVEGELQHLTRRHELKNVGRFEVRPSEARTASPGGGKEQQETQTAYPRPSETRKEGVGRSASDDRSRPSERSEARE